ncbi:HpcH/HpaI aldolase family protein [Ancylobacter mangrovi]|uniref:HpcH/HpaI aldolase family protein n=1 Tax=Ancylobacter mangrovi TaxID=2972472 RepID=UPI0021631FFF|nr:aldolase/citrate lyase family protein [Ancylobacter mangrovi]MCS0500828.1 aldolase/citrate lyase family protein [Ancylobacter mangrovi]
MTGRDRSWSSNAVKSAAASGATIRGVHFTFPAPTAIEVLAPLELDFVYLDGEHGSFETRDLDVSCLAAERYGMVPIARVPDRTSGTIIRFLDRGVRGIVLPHVCSVDDAKDALDAIYYRPLGNRSFGGGRPHFLSIEDLPAHLAMCNAAVSVGVMIETASGLEAAADIARLEGVDYLSFGMNDLAQDLGHPGEPNHPEVQRRFKACAERIRAAGKPVREDFMKFAWINQVILAGARQFIETPTGQAY